MKRKKGRAQRLQYWILLGFLFAASLSVLSIKWYTKQRELYHSPQNGMFEWDDRTVKNVSSALELAEKLHITRWYQEISDNLDETSAEDLASFVRQMHEKGIEVYLLVGSVEWGFEENGESLIQHLAELLAYQKDVSEAEKIDGVMLDIEPYITSEWKSDPAAYMSAYVSGMRQAYQFASAQDVRVAVCIPRHYDIMGLEQELEELIAEACDEVAVMNYGCGDETEQIETEEKFARRYKKELHCILEFQEVGKHGLTERETYANKGLEAADAVWNEMQKAYPKTRIIRDYHCAAALQDMLDVSQ